MDLQPLTSRRLGIAAALAVCVALPGMLWAQGDIEKAQENIEGAQGETGGLEQAAPDQSVTTRALPGTVDMVLGVYQHNPVQNDWHIGSIVQDSAGLRWTNKAGVSWRLTPDLANQRLMTGPDNPYYAQGLREFNLIVSNGQITGFTFAGGTYQRTSPPVQAQAPMPPQVQPQVQPQILSSTSVPPMVPTGLPPHQLRRLWGTGNVSGDGPGAVAWLIGDLNGDGKDEVIQPWANGSTLGMIVYGVDETGVMKRLWGTSRVSGDGAGAVAWLIGDLNGDGRDEVIQQWASAGNILGTIVYGSRGADYKMEKLWGTSRVSGDGAGAVAWLIGDLNGDGKDEVIQQWASKDNTLGTIVYGTTGLGHAMTKLWGTQRVSGDGASAVAWLVGDLNGDGQDEVIQQWKNGSVLGNLTYKAPYTSVPVTTDEEKTQLLKDHAPLIWLAKDEAYFPSSVDWAFQGEVRFKNSDGNYWLRTKTPLSSPSDESLPLFKGNRNLADVPVYAFWIDKGECLDLVYWTYYPYNRGKAERLSAVGTGAAVGLVGGCLIGGPIGCGVGLALGTGVGAGVSAIAGPTVRGNHVGDWEHITVRLVWVYEKKRNQWSRNVQGVYIGAHDFGGAYSWSSVKKEGGTHPIVYSAWGSHGYYTTAGEQQYKDLPELVDHTSEGTKWMTWTNVLTYDYSASKGLGGNAWPRWMSKDTTNPGVGDPSNPAAGGIYRWGNPEQSGDNCLRSGIEIRGKKLDVNTCRLENGPVGPAHKGVWDPAVFE